MNNLIKYFYSWYTFPIVIAHEYLHRLGCVITKTKVKSFRIYKTDIGLYNGEMSNDIPTEKWKLYTIVYMPILLIVLPLLLSFFFYVAWFISLYILSTIIYYKKQIIWMVFPSQMDFVYIDYCNYSRNIISKFVKEIDIIKSIENNSYNDLLNKYNIPTFIEYINIIYHNHQ